MYFIRILIIVYCNTHDWYFEYCTLVQCYRLSLCKGTVTISSSSPLSTRRQSHPVSDIQWIFFSLRQWKMSKTLVALVTFTVPFNNMKYISFLDQKPPSGWPAKGMIQFEHTYLKYCLTDPPVLKDLNFSIQPSQKVCRCMNKLPWQCALPDHAKSGDVRLK